MGLPSVTMSGTTPCVSNPQKWEPTRPKPHCTCTCSNECASAPTNPPFKKVGYHPPTVAQHLYVCMHPDASQLTREVERTVVVGAPHGCTCQVLAAALCAVKLKTLQHIHSSRCLAGRQAVDFNAPRRRRRLRPQRASPCRLPPGIHPAAPPAVISVDLAQTSRMHITGKLSMCLQSELLVFLERIDDPQAKLSCHQRGTCARHHSSQTCKLSCTDTGNSAYLAATGQDGL